MAEKTEVVPALLRVWILLSHIDCPIFHTKTCDSYMIDISVKCHVVIIMMWARTTQHSGLKENESRSLTLHSFFFVLWKRGRFDQWVLETTRLL